MPLIGTAGHVDHGKSTLIQTLTGRDPDRWAEEKRRGLTIDLGFGWTTLPNGTDVSFVDVPGHERYLKNMLAGIEAIDIALFVVAADEGWMPQSEEHLAVLDLLEVGNGVIALTKSDLVDSDLLELATTEVTDKLEGTSLEGAAIVPLSGTTGDGINVLVSHLQELTASVTPSDIGRPRLWVDRSFTASGAGTIVTGTLLDGPVVTDERVTIYPGERSARIRGIQSHENQVDHIGPGRRIALNLSGIERTEVGRGDMIGLPDQWTSSTRFVAALRTARYVDEIERRGAYQLHVGSSVHPVEIVGMDDGVAVFTTSEPIPLTIGDRFVVRDTGRKLVVGGGRVLDPEPGATRNAMTLARSIDPDAHADELAARLISIRGSADAARISAQTRGGNPPDAIEVAGQLLSTEAFGSLGEKAARLVATEHEAHPLRVGLPLATLAERLGVNSEIAELVVSETSGLERVGPDIAASGRTVGLPEKAQAEWERARAELGVALAVPTVAELGLDSELLHLQLRRGELVRVSEDLVWLPHQIDEIRRLLGSLPEEFTVAQFRDAVGLSRKYAVPLLEWADKKGLTVRKGDTRTLL
ncbi:MAG: selenocysteine-specific translation elongation factor [Acidimicrobiia bacterium]